VSAPSLPELIVGHWQVVWSLDVQGALWVGVYLWAALRLRGRWPLWRAASFAAGVGSVLVALQSGVDRYDDRLLSVHMVQHLLLLELAPLLLLAGRPALLLLRTLPPDRRRGPARALARFGRWANPIVCLAVFYVVVLASHLPSFYDATLAQPGLHAAEHAVYLLAGLLLWWPLLDSDPSPQRRLNGLGRLIYLLAAMPPMAVIGAWLNRDPTLAYPAYASPAHTLGISAVSDQQHAGAIMWVAGGMLIVAVGLWTAIGAMVAEERRLRGREAREALP
jgi:cytochrome c oxidase assembly factor CtaG